jgi:hypothetical protein
MTNHLRLCAIATVAAAALSGCGKMGDLERPGPVFGQARTGTPAAAPAAATRTQDPTRPVSTIDPRASTADTTTNPAPPRTIPIPGQGQDANRPQPQGSLPDPYANPTR